MDRYSLELFGAEKMCRYPNRSESHVLEADSERFFINCLPNNWTSEKPLNDYGIDQRVEIFNGESAEGLELLIQLKASENENSDNEYEKFRLKVPTYNNFIEL